MNENYPFGTDIARGDGMGDWEKVVANKVVFVGIRATISWGYQDSWFPFSSSEAKRVGIYRLPYHVVYPGESARRQMDNFLKVATPDTRDKLVLDVELVHNCSKKQISDCVQEMLTILVNETGSLPIIYSRASFVDACMEYRTWYSQVDWWLAQYLLAVGREYPCPPRLPKGVSRWLVHQTTDTGSPIGFQSKEADYDRWNGDPNLYFNHPTGVIYSVVTKDENIHQLPPVQSEVITTLFTNDKVEIMKEQDGWGEINRTWISNVESTNYAGCWIDLRELLNTQKK